MSGTTGQRKSKSVFLPLITGFILSSLIILVFYVIFAFLTPSEQGILDWSPLVRIERLALPSGDSSVSVSPGWLTYLITAAPSFLGLFATYKKWKGEGRPSHL
jgi:hypothetical protein